MKGMLDLKFKIAGKNLYLLFSSWIKITGIRFCQNTGYIKKEKRKFYSK